MFSKRITAGLVAGISLLAAAAPALAAPNVTIRVEGEQQTLLPRTPITLLDAPEPRTNCPGNSVAAAIEVGTRGNWDGQSFVQTIMGETHDFSRNDYWSVWVWRGGRFLRANGICDELLAEGEHALAHVDIYDANFEPTVLPLAVLGVPAKVGRGETFTVRVMEYRCENQYCPPGDGLPAPRAGATVTAGSASAVSDADGYAQLAVTGEGDTAVRATAPSRVPSASEPLCVGACGAATPGGTTQTTTTTTPTADVTDRVAPAARIGGIREQQRFPRRRAPRTLRGTVSADPSGLSYVKLRLTRRHRGLCQYFSGRQERFRRTRCGTGAVFGVEATTSWSYLLPSRLPAGRYVLDAITADRAGNRDLPARGRNRIVFFVR